MLWTAAGQYQREQAERGNQPERAARSGPEEHYGFILSVRIRSNQRETVEQAAL